MNYPLKLCLSSFCAATLFTVNKAEDIDGIKDGEEDDFETDDDDDEVTEMEVENQMQKRKKVSCLFDMSLFPFLEI